MNPHRIILNGKQVETNQTKTICSPWSGEEVGEVCFAGSEQISESLSLGARASATMRNLRAYQRADILHKAADLIASRKEVLARTITLESGKPIREARAEAIRAESTFRLAAESVRQLEGHILPVDVTPAAGDRIALVSRFPVGLVTGISPFNFPLNLVAHKVAPAIASACAINLKPASSTPMTALMLGNLLLEAGLPEGACNILPCESRLAVPLIEDPRVKLITFTGSGAVGWGIKQRAVKKRVCLELGGNAVVIVEPTTDLEAAVKRIVVGGYAYSGQICISIQHVLVQEDVFEAFKERYVQLVASLKMGDPIDDSTEIASMIDLDEAIRIEEWISEAVKADGKILTGGYRNGNKVTPTIMIDVPDSCRISRDEVFGPVTVLRSYSKFEEAVDWVNSQQYGLQTGIFTNDLNQAMNAFNRLEVGGVIIGDIPTFRADNYPYGGVKESGFGREGVKYAIEEMTELRTLVLPSPH